MNTIDLSSLIKGLMVVIGVAISLGKLDALKHRAAMEAFGSSGHRTFSKVEIVRKVSGTHVQNTRKKCGSDSPSAYKND